MNRFLTNLQSQAEDNPILALGVAAALMTAVSKLSNSRAEMKNAKSWDRETLRRAMKSTSK